jgi:hypothetical protein
MSGTITVDDFYSRVQELINVGEAGGLSSDDMSIVFGQACRELQSEDLPPPVTAQETACETSLQTRATA